MLPLLRLVTDGEPHRLVDLVEQIGDAFQLTEPDRAERLPSGQERLLNRVAWARTYMAKAGLLEGVGRGSVRITDRGRSLLAEKPQRIDMRVLKATAAAWKMRPRCLGKQAIAGSTASSKRTASDWI